MMMMIAPAASKFFSGKYRPKWLENEPKPRIAHTRPRSTAPTGFGIIFLARHGHEGVFRRAPGPKSGGGRYDLGSGGHARDIGV